MKKWQLVLGAMGSVITVCVVYAAWWFLRKALIGFILFVFFLAYAVLTI